MTFSSASMGSKDVSSPSSWALACVLISHSRYVRLASVSMKPLELLSIGFKIELLTCSTMSTISIMTGLDVS